MNEKGLICGYLVMNDTVYPTVDKDQYNNSLAVSDFCMWILGSFSSVGEVVRGHDRAYIWGNKVPVLNVVMPLHIPIHDAMGNNFVIEFINGKIFASVNKLGVLTNEPALNYQLKNLGAYNSLNPYPAGYANINGEIIPSTDSTGMDAIPGGWNSMARFVRIATLIRYISPIKTAQDAVLTANWILNSVYVPPGIAITNFNSNNMVVTTRWDTIKDSTNLKFYIRSDDGVLRYIDLKRIDFSSNTTHTPYIVRQPPFSIDITSKVN